MQAVHTNNAQFTVHSSNETAHPVIKSQTSGCQGLSLALKTSQDSRLRLRCFSPHLALKIPNLGLVKSTLVASCEIHSVKALASLTHQKMSPESLTMTIPRIFYCSSSTRFRPMLFGGTQ